MSECFNFVLTQFFLSENIQLCLLTLFYKDHIFLKSVNSLGDLWQFMAYNKHHKANMLTLSGLVTRFPFSNLPFLPLYYKIVRK